LGGELATVQPTRGSERTGKACPSLIAGRATIATRDASNTTERNTIKGVHFEVGPITPHGVHVKMFGQMSSMKT
jgi:hypothetical protein